jgi:hypothetical protein
VVGFIPTIGLFVLAYMWLGFGQSWVRAAVAAALVTVFCWAVFDQGLAVPWPQALLGDAVPWLRETTALM